MQDTLDKLIECQCGTMTVAELLFLQRLVVERSAVRAMQGGQWRPYGRDVPASLLAGEE